MSVETAWRDWGTGHPSLQIRGSVDWSLWGRCVALGVTGSAAAYKSVDLARLLMRLGATVRVVMTGEAARLVSPALFEWATGLPAVTRLTGAIEHVALARRCHALLVAPATLDTLSEIAGLRASTPVTSLAQEMLGLGKPVLLVPAMHLGMWRRAQRLIEELSQQGAAVMAPRVEGEQAKYPDPWLVAWWAEARILRGGDLEGRRVLVTAGPTREHIDSVRVVTNPSTGLMGVSLALEAAWRGAKVALVHGPLSCCSWTGWRNYLASVTSVETAEEMRDAVLEAVKNVDMAFYAAAVSDYAPEKTVEGKLPSTRGPLTLRLLPTPKIVGEAVAAAPTALHVGFAAEPLTGEDLVAKAREKLERYRLDMIAANSTVEPGAGFAAETNRVALLDWKGRLATVSGHKRVVARRILDEALNLLARGERRPRD